MSDDEKQPIRISQWFARGIGIIIASLFITIISFVFFGNLEESLFYNDTIPTIDYNFLLLGRTLGKTMWTYRVYDVILIVILLLMGVISVYYMTIFKSKLQARNEVNRRRLL